MTEIYMLLPSGAYEVWRDIPAYDLITGGLAIRTDRPVFAPTGSRDLTGPPETYLYPVWHTTEVGVARVLSQDAEFVQRDLGARVE